MPIVSQARSLIRFSALSFAALLLTFSTPLLGLSSADCTPPDPSQPGVHAPNGADSSTYTYQCDGAYAGKWTNPYYVYDPADSSRTPLYDLAYSYDCDSAKWTMTKYSYSPSSGSFYSHRVDAGARPGVPTGCVTITPDDEAGPSANAADGSSNGINNTGPNSNNGINNSSNNNTGYNNTTNASVSNLIGGVATSGSSMVLDNTVAGSAGTGNTQSIADIVNMLQSTSNALGTDSNVVVFNKDIDGDVIGDLMLDPTQLTTLQNSVANTGPDSNNNINNTDKDSLIVNNSVNADINNDVNLVARSGDATVSGNTRAGDATTGNAKAVANITNIINSALTAGKSFIGTININGNLNGDILLPDNFVDQLLAANTPTVTISTTGPDSNNNVNNNSSDSTKVTNTNDLGITNNVTAGATSGSAKVSGNTNAGSATTGNAKTNITAFNLTGSKVIGSNALLVFVNSHGNWVGLIVNAPAGSSAAALGGGISSTGPNSNNNVNNNDSSSTDVNNNVKARINNNVKVNAVSGDAKVKDNTFGGSARSGDADSAVNLLNIENSDLTLSGWLGILFINVFGTWNGSFGVNTSAGDKIVAQTLADNGQAPAQMQVFSFKPAGSAAASGSGSNNYALSSYIGSGSGTGSSAVATSAVLAAATKQNPQGREAGTQSSFNWVLVASSLSLFFIWLAGERAYQAITIRRRS